MIFVSLHKTGWKNLFVTAKVSVASESTTNGESALSGMKGQHHVSKSVIIIEAMT